MTAWKKRLVLALVVIGALLILAWGARLVQIGLSLREHLAQAEALVESPGEVDLTEACVLVRDLRDDVVALRQDAGLLIQLAPALDWLPQIGGEMRAAPHLVNTADGLTEAGALACDALEPALAALGGEEESDSGFSMEQVTRLLAEERPTLERAATAAARAQAAWAQVDVQSLSPWVADKTAKLSQGLPLLRAALEAATAAPDLLGANGPRTYLVLAQNDDELRPTGGFISGVVRVTVDGGQIAEMSFIDAGLVDDYLNKPYPDPPEPLLSHMGSQIWVFQDSNWSPDFPTSARQAAYFYEYGQGVPVDGVVALDQYAIELLVGALGEIHIPDTAEPVTAANVRNIMREAWNPGEGGVSMTWVYSRKEFIGRLASTILDRIQNDPGSVDWVQMAKALYAALEGHHLMIFVKDTAGADAIAQAGWDGTLRANDGGDYLMVVDANLGFNKVNALIDEALDYRVTLRADGTAAAELSLTYTHRGKWEGITCQQFQPWRKEELTYSWLMHRCYYDYLRVYVPAGSALRAATPHPTPGDYLLSGEPTDGRAIPLGEEVGKAVFAQFFVVAYGQQLTTRFEYDLPQVVQPNGSQNSYTLLIQKQAGTGSTPVSLTVLLPPGAKLLAATPTPQAIDKGTLTFELKLDADILVVVVYE